MGRERARASTVLGAKVTSLCDSDPARALALANQYPGSHVCSDAKEIDWSGMDAIFVCLPPGTRGPIEMEAIRFGVPFFIEKPIGTSTGQCISLLEALRSRPVIHSVGYMNRYRDSVLRIRRLLATGEPLGLICYWVASVYGVPWWLRPTDSGGPFNEQGTHFIDLCRYLLGEIVQVTAHTPNSTMPADLADTVIALLEFSSGILGSVFYSCRASVKQISFKVFSAEATLSLEGWDLRFLDSQTTQLPSPPAREDVYLKEVSSYFEAIRRSNQSLVKCDLEDAARTQLVVDAILRSLSSKRPETVPTLDSHLQASSHANPSDRLVELNPEKHQG
jgi:myo-inositol 2-dehydrogenase / D-chiro-inositol 1-dehydrogenase